MKSAKKKTIRSIMKRSLHPLLSYAVLFGVGAIAVSSTGSIAGTNTEEAAPVPVAVHVQTQTVAPVDLAKLKASAFEFSAQLAIIKGQVAELEKYGRNPDPALKEAIGQGEQFASMIMQAQTPGEIGVDDPAAKLQSIGAAIAANSKF
jgi:hypothetical protein